MKLIIASDHAGYELKQQIKAIMPTIQWVDFGTSSTDSVDYPDFGHKAAKAISMGQCERGILICGSGIGMSIVANKIPGIRAALCHNKQFAELCKRHNNANVLVLPGRFISKYLAKEMIETWLQTEFEDGRHNNRIDKIRKIEEEVV